jgi:small basic protein
MISVAFVVVFLVGIAIGDILFAHASKPMQTASYDAMAVISLLDRVPPNMR